MVSPHRAQVQTNWPQPGQPEPYFSCTASARSTPATLAIVASQASTSANSSRRSSCVPLRKRGGQLAHFFHQPHERAVDAAGDVFLQVHLADQLLKLGDRGG